MLGFIALALIGAWLVFAWLALTASLLLVSKVTDYVWVNGAKRAFAAAAIAIAVMVVGLLALDQVVSVSSPWTMNLSALVFAFVGVRVGAFLVDGVTVPSWRAAALIIGLAALPQLILQGALWL